MPARRQGKGRVLSRVLAGAAGDTHAVLGTLCILDRKLLSISVEQVDALVALARRVAGDLELRAQLSKSQSALATERHAHAAEFVHADMLAAALNGLDEAVILFNHKRIEDRADFLRRIAVLPDGPYVGREDFVLKGPPRRVARWTSRPVVFADGNFGQLSVYRDVTAEAEQPEVEREPSP